METPLISVIIPVYNIAEYLPRCIDSVISQTYKQLEIILIDDGSTDRSPEICKSYVQKDRRIKFISKKNGGQGSARNLGLSLCTGDFVTFVDSDDWLVNDIYSHCVNIIKKSKPDIVSFNCIETNGDVEIDKDLNFQLESVYKDELLRDYLYRGQTDRAPFTVWRKVYKKEIIEKIQFDEGKINEDIVFNFKVLSKANSLIHTSKIGYYYYQGNKSTTRNGLKKRDFDLLDASEQLIELAKIEKNKDIYYLARVKEARSYFSLLAKIAMYGFEDDTLDQKEVIKSLKNKLRKKYIFLLKSPIPLSRKLMAGLLIIDVRLLSEPLKMYKKIKK
ncbi:Glycosyltransferase involved in cell wall bisynthesis [Carnobacterium alterfunditum]|uniref:Glycosyltransferase involved in cell wall bisynthesis n=1 Tax=Carnobacterium alterfunditum TaxID=28230 RepID=A0A1N6HJQ8_9LACT|nr:glycosyltransferase [Carnobacterium alterfunditum]SIO19967.1 Glycosyltransferase involved in cell wall bisynthesis [Carnobacterium alterfunditum]